VVFSVKANHRGLSMSIVDTILTWRDFKVACDGLLLHELGPLVQTYAASGPDGGVDADLDGSVGQIKGRWVFQYKFSSPTEGVSRRRSQLRRAYLGPKSEFDKKGVKGAVGYVLVTNIPVTPDMKSKLASAWSDRRGAQSFLIWDPSRLNVLLKEYADLARSWSGVREARCHETVIQPLWAWLQDLGQVVAAWSEAPLFPLDVVNTMTKVPQPTFNPGFGWEYRVILGRSRPVAALFAVRNQPHFSYANEVAFPKALKPLGALLSAINILEKEVRREVSVYRTTILNSVPLVASIEDVRQREDISELLAFCVLEQRWGFAMGGLHGLQNDQLIVRGNIIAWAAPGLSQIESTLDTLVGAPGRGEVPSGVQRARERVGRAWARLAEGLWHAVEIGVDADPQRP
jgi:hypothetical protein